MTEPTSLAALYPRRSAFVSPALLAAAICLALGCVAPLMTFRKFFIFSDSISLLSALADLWIGGYWLLFLIIGCFSILVPIAKLIILTWLWHARFASFDDHHGRLRFLDVIGKWSMLDVFVVAMLIISLKLAGIANVELRYGLYAFTAAVLLTMLLTAYVQRLSRQQEAQKGDGGNFY